jgi:hypothetical protein
VQCDLDCLAMDARDFAQERYVERVGRAARHLERRR